MKIRVDIEPRAKGRAKTHFINGHAITYTPKKTRDAQEFIAEAVLEYKNLVSFTPNTPLKLAVTFFRHKSIWLKGIQKKEKLPVRKPDLDNFIKLLLDSLNGVIIKDDSQITSIEAKKRYSPDGIGYIEFELSEDTDG